MFRRSPKPTGKRVVAGSVRKNEEVKVIVGLGNPGKQYEKTRHNAGFQFVDQIACRFQVHLQERKFRASWGAGMIEGCRTLLVKPLTFMNRSGEAVREVLSYFGISHRRMLVVHDDLDLECGRIKVVRRGGAGGHRGVLSIIENVGARDFPRFKLGIGRPRPGEGVEAYVLQEPSSREKPSYEAMIDGSVEAARMVLTVGLEAAMNRFNRCDPQGEAV